MQRAGLLAADVVRSGRIRVGLFLPQYAKNPVSGDIQGIGTGFIAIEIAHSLAARLGIVARFMEYPSPKAAIAGLKGDTCDVVFLGVEPSRAAEVDFSPPLFQFDYTYLVPAGSAIRSIGDADRPGVRIAIVSSHASALALRRIATGATLVGSELPDDAFGLLRRGQVDAFALPREQLDDYSARLPGSRVLEDSYGINRVAMAVAKGRAAWLAYVSEFAMAAKVSGLIARAIARGNLQSFAVAAA